MTDEQVTYTQPNTKVRWKSKRVWLIVAAILSLGGWFMGANSKIEIPPELLKNQSPYVQDAVKQIQEKSAKSRDIKDFFPFLSALLMAGAGYFTLTSKKVIVSAKAKAEEVNLRIVPTPITEGKFEPEDTTRQKFKSVPTAKKKPTPKKAARKITKTKKKP